MYNAFSPQALDRSLKELAKSAVERSIVRPLAFIKHSLERNSTTVADPYEVIWSRAALAAANYIEPRLGSALLFRQRERLWDYALRKARRDGLMAEFGVFWGYSINYFARRLRKERARIYGFDSFEGLKEDWCGTQCPVGAFGLRGRLPRVLSNVSLVKGWFDETIPRFLEDHAGSFSFVHLDADTYESTALVLRLIESRLGPGAVIVFDDYIGVPNWENGEFRAWQEFVAARKITYRYLGFASRSQAAVQIA